MQISVLLFPRFSNLCLANVVEPLRAANDLSGQALFSWQLASLDGAAQASSSGIRVDVDKSLSDARGDMLIAIPSYGTARQSPAAITRGLRAAAGRFEVMAGYDMGAWMLADAGLLDGHEATIHWDELDAFAEQFPEVNAQRARHVWSRDRLTCAGAAAAFEVALDMVEKAGGPALRLDVALLFIQPGAAGRPGSPSGHSRRLARVLDLMNAHIEQPLATDKIAAKTGMSPRALDRLVGEGLSTSPAALYRRLRLLRARKLAEETDLPVTELAIRSGYADASAMTRAFRREFGVSPRALRQR